MTPNPSLQRTLPLNSYAVRGDKVKLVIRQALLRRIAMRNSLALLAYALLAGTSPLLLAADSPPKVLSVEGIGQLEWTDTQWADRFPPECAPAPSPGCDLPAPK